MGGQVLDLEFQIGMCVISVTRFLTDHRAGLPLSATVRLLDTQDFLMTLCPLIEKAPWVRKSIRGEVQKYEKQEWVLVDEEDMGKLPELQVQLFLAVHNLVMDQDCRNRYNLTSVRKDNLLRLRRFLNEVVFDQVPPLANLLRTLEELSITGQYTGAEEAHTPFVVELIAEMRERLRQRDAGRAQVPRKHVHDPGRADGPHLRCLPRGCRAAARSARRSGIAVANAKSAIETPQEHLH